MNKDVLVVILIAVIVTFSYFLLHPVVKTQRKIPESVLLEQEMSYESENHVESVNDYPQTIPKYSPVPLMPKPKPKMKNHVNFAPNTPVKSDKTANLLPKIPVVKRERHSLGDNLSVCAPYKETMTTEYMGMKMNYSIEILGWVNSKCILNFESKMLDAGTTFEDNYGFSPDSAEVFGFAPKVRCEFSPKQLQLVEDSFLLEERTQNRRMLKAPSQIVIPDIEDMSFSDIKLLKILLSDRACKVVNANDFVQIFESLFSF